ncbi:MAG: UvrB/UvrC motif-containing protein [bacterium]|nr:UvrB/UvrC motif-containing protein [bacterium]
MYNKKPCAKCGKDAVFKFTRIKDGQVFDIYLCAEHAVEMSPYQKPKAALSDILEGLLKQELHLKPTGPQAPSELRCKMCGLPFEAYKRNLLLGCSDCYESFREFLIPELRRMHGGTRHVGRRPGGKMTPIPRPEPAPELKEIDPATAAAKVKFVTSPTKGGKTLIKDPLVAIDELKRAMKKAIADEDYNKAALCRDQIRELQEQAKGSESETHSA